MYWGCAMYLCAHVCANKSAIYPNLCISVYLYIYIYHTHTHTPLCTHVVRPLSRCHEDLALALGDFEACTGETTGAQALSYSGQCMMV